MRLTASRSSDGQLAQRDARLARHEIGVQPAPPGLVFDRAFQRAQGRHAAAAGDLQRHLAFADGQREHAVGHFPPPAVATPSGPSEKLTGFNFAAAKTCSSAARWALGMPASVTCCLPAASGQREFASRSVATSQGKPRSASSCSRLAASASGNGGSSVCAVSTHFSGTPTTQWRSRTPAASR